MKKTILVVDDQEGIRLLLKELFCQEGFHAVTAQNGQEALQLMQEQQADCVLLDMKLPGMGGLEVLERLKQKWPDLPVFMMTAYEDLELVKRASQLGAEQYFTKPFDIFELKDTVQSLFEG